MSRGPVPNLLKDIRDTTHINHQAKWLDALQTDDEWNIYKFLPLKDSVFIAVFVWYSHKSVAPIRATRFRILPR